MLEVLKVTHHLCHCLVAGDLLGRGAAVEGVGVRCRLDDGGEIANLDVQLVVASFERFYGTMGM